MSTQSGSSRQTPASLSDVAHRACVSTATVSRVLSGSRTKDDAIGAAVRKAAKELGYQVNSTARALRKERTDTIGLIVPYIGDPFFSSLAEHLESAANETGMELLICASSQNVATEATRLDALLSRQVDGIIIVPCDETRSRQAINSTAQRIPLVQIDQRVRSSKADWIGIDDDQAMELMLSHLYEQGAKTAAFIGSVETNSSAVDRLQGFRRHCQALGIGTRSDWVLLGSYSVEWGREASARILGGGMSMNSDNHLSQGRAASGSKAISPQQSFPQALVCANDLIAFGALDTCRHLGLAVPTDIRVTGIDDTAFARLSSPSLTTIAQPIDQIATEAVRLIDTRRQHRDWQTSTLMLTPRLVVRESA